MAMMVVVGITLDDSGGGDDFGDGDTTMDK